MNLGDVCRKISLNNIKIKQKDYLPQGSFPIVDQGSELIGGYSNETKFIVPEEPPYVIFGDHTKVKKYINFKFIAGADGIKVLKPLSELDSKFLFYCLHILKIPDKGYARHFQFLEKENFPIPPLFEQQQIVSKIEELFSELDKGKQQLEAVRLQLKTYRQAVLKWAFEGHLTENWRKQNRGDKKIHEFQEEIKSKREAWAQKNGKRLKPISELNTGDLPSLPENWVWVRVVETVLNTADDIVDGPFGSNLKNSDYVKGAPIPVIGISNIEEGFKTKIRYITREKFETIKRSAVHPGDIIVAKIGSTYGKTGVYPEWMPIGVIPANLIRIRPSEHFEKKLLIYFLKSALFKKSLDNIMKSTAQPAYNVSKFKDLPIPFMSLEEQRILISEIETRLSVCDKMEGTITNSLQQSESLRQSILKQAFEGKLI